MKNKILWYLILFIAYIVLVSIFLVNLNNFNKEIMSFRYVEIMYYNSGEAWNYLIKAVIYVFLGVFGIFLIWKNRKYINNLSTFIIYIIFTGAIIIMCILIIYFIQNPILRAALFCILFGGLILSYDN